jgi:uncharacterized protein involved in outer membrane biogenesis
MTRRRRVLLVVAAGLVVLGAVGLAVLPEIARRVAETQLAKLTGRAVVIQGVDLNVFTGRLAVKRFRLAQREGKDAAIEFERLEVRVGLLSLLTSNVRVRELTLTRPTIRVTRTGPAEFDFSDILARLPAADPNAKPSTRAVTVERLTLAQATVLARDQAVTPAAEWRVEDLGVELQNLTTREGAGPGHLEVALKLNGARIAVKDGGVALKPLAFSGRVAVDGFDLAAAVPYIPPGLPAAPRAGRLTAGLDVALEKGAEALGRLRVAGEVKLEGLEVIQTGGAAPFLVLPRLAVAIKEADLVARSITVASVELDGLDLKVARDAKGVIDLLALAATPAGDAPAAPPAPAPAAAGPTAQPAPQLQLRISDIALRGSKAAFTDAMVAPVTTLVLTNLTARVRDLTWPSTAPADLEVATTLPGGGKLELKGRVTPLPLDLEIVTSMRNAPIRPYAAYIPVNAAFAGTFNGDSRSRVRIANGAFTAQSKGTSWIDGLELQAPGETTPAARLERVRLDGIDFAWPQHAKAAKVTVTKPEIRLERDADGTINLRKLFEPRSAPGGGTVGGTAGLGTTLAAAPPTVPPPGAASAATASAEKEKKSTLPLAVELGQIVVEDGFARFLDRTTTPAFSETVSRLNLTIDGLSNEPGRRAKLTMQGIVGGDAALDLRGEIAPLGELYADLVGELRDFSLPSVNPYAESFVAWFLRSGKLGVRIHYRVEKDQLTADNEIIVQNLTVAPSQQHEDEVKKRIGLPLGLIVALITDSKNGIKFNVPISGPLAQWQVGISDAIWAAIKNAVVNIVAAPFRAIGRLFKGKDDTVEELKVEPVTFAAGSAVLAPAMERHLTQVGDFLRKAPLIKLGLAPVLTARDSDSLRAQELTARLQKLQQERGLADYAAAVTLDLRERLPEVPLPEKAEEQLALLRAREPLPPARLAELQTRRLDAVREALVKVEGIPADRLIAAGDAPATAAPAPPSAPAPSASAAADAVDGRIEFRIAN